jgi:hypothetical protein
LAKILFQLRGGVRVSYRGNSHHGAADGGNTPASGRTRIVILHVLGTQVEGGHFALVAPGLSAAGARELGCPASPVDPSVRLSHLG